MPRLNFPSIIDKAPKYDHIAKYVGKHPEELIHSITKEIDPEVR